MSSDSQRVSNGQARPQAVFDRSTDAIFLVDEHMRFMDANPAGCALMGYSREELLRLGVPDVTPLANQSLLATLWQVLNAAGKLDGEYQLLRKDGTTIVVEFRAVAKHPDALEHT